jgi:Ca2+-binding RTX toxin-like protein
MTQYDPVIELSQLSGSGGAEPGFVINGIDPDDNSGRSVASAGDVNGDGFDDIIVGAWGGDPGGDIYAGETYVVFGKAGSFNSTLDLSSLDGTNGFRLDGVGLNDLSGCSVASAGDVNGDGFDDILIGAYGASPGFIGVAGESYIVFGKAGGFGASLDLSTLDGNNGFRLDGIDPNDRSGRSVASAGDINGDGFDDILIGAYFADPGGDNDAGETYVVFGKAGGFGASLALSALDGANGFRLDGIDPGDFSGRSVASAGDFNGDGFDDIMVGAPRAKTTIGDEGVTYIVFGAAGGFAASLSLGNLDGTNGFRLDGVDADDLSASSVASAGDINGDGFDDILIGAFIADPGGNGNAGETYVVFGRPGGFGVSLDLSALDGTNGFRLDGIDAYDFSGASVASAGDVNGDGFDDILIGAYFADPDGAIYAGETYVVFGKASGFGGSLSLSALDGDNGFRLEGIDAYDYSGRSVASAGDINGDGFDDLLIGAFGGDPGGDTDAGETYVVLGRKPDAAVTRTGTNTAQTLAGGDFDDTLRGLAGDDRLFGHGGNDVLDGGANSDTMTGGTGNDTYRVDNVGDRIVELAGGGTDNVLARISLALAANVENATAELNLAINLTGNGLANTLTGNGAANTLSGLTGNDVLIGNEGNDTLLGSTGFDTMNGGAGNDFLVGGLNRDVMTGGSGADDFDFNSRSETGRSAATRDFITDFQHLIDDIDLRTMDANTTKAGNQAFQWIGGRKFSEKAGELHFIRQGGDTIIEGDVNGDGRADLQIELDGIIALSRADFFL